MAREVFLEVATMLHNGLALDDLDEHDAEAVVACLCVDLCAADPGAAVRARARVTSEEPGDLHDPEAAAAAYLTAAGILQILIIGTAPHARMRGPSAASALSRMRRAGR